jgi:hypothetical protein
MIGSRDRERSGLEGIVEGVVKRKTSEKEEEYSQTIRDR